jgi:hypothetical protein
MSRKNCFGVWVLGVVCLSGGGTPVAASDSAPAWYNALTVGGYLQGSYVGNLSSPQQGPLAAKPTNVARLFDQETNSFNLNAFHLQIAKPVGDDGVGFTSKLLFGRDARQIKSSGWSDKDYDVHEAYLTYVPPAVKNLSLVAGKFVTLEGLEVIESPFNPNFSEGLLFVFGEPFTHTGVKGTYIVNDKVNATVGVVNGWDTTSDANDGKTVIWQIATTPCKYATWSLQGSYGPEALTTNQSERTSLDTLLGMTPTDKLSLWFQANWGQDTHLTRSGGADPVFDNSTGAVGPSTVRWSGFGTWVQYAATSWLTEALRFEIFDDQGGANRLGGIASTVTTAPVTPVAANQTMKEVTWTSKFQLAKNMFTRLEYRHDWSNMGVFPGHAPGQLGKDQNTVSADWVIAF